MSEDPKAPMPPQPTTKELTAPDKASLQFSELRVLLINGFKMQDEKSEERFKAQDEKIEARFVQLETNFELKGEQIQAIQGQVHDLVIFKSETIQRLKNNSGRAAAFSSNDMNQDAKLAQALMALEEEKKRGDKLEANAATKDDLKAITAAQTSAIGEVVKEAVKNPLVRQVGTEFARFIIAVLTLATAYLGYLALKGHG